MKRIILIPIIFFVKSLTALLKYTKKGSGTALPGLIIDKYFPWALEELLKQIPNVIVITGTNGKTTTQTILRSILDEEKSIKFLTNKAGANLTRGIVSELLKQSTKFGELDFTHAVFEVEEATLPKIAEKLNPKFIVVTNLYRDQLDAYGEVDITEKHIVTAIKKCPNAKILLNLDDPRVSQMTQNLPNDTIYVSLPESFRNDLPYEGEKTTNSVTNKSIVKAKNIKINDDLSSTFQILSKAKNQEFKIENLNLSVPGYFHIYNALFAITISKLLGLDDNNISKGISSFKPAFGRGEVLEKIDENNKKVNYRLLLVKNPAGFSLNLSLLNKISRLKLLICINDNTADGKDVSWLWDSKIELLNSANIDWIMTTGVRAKDMQVRLKYALDNPSKTILTHESIGRIINESFDKANDGDTIYVLPTYTAMLEFRKLMGKTLE